jgi:hypothetical protein
MNNDKRAKVLDLTILTRSITVNKDRTNVTDKLTGFGRAFLEFLFLGIVLIAVFGAILHYMTGTAQAATVLPDGNIFGAVWKLVSGWGGLDYMVKVNAIVTILVSSMKVSFLKPFWDKIKKIKITYKGVVQYIDAQIYFVAFLHIALGIITQGNYTFPAILAYVFIGGGSVYFHEITEGLKNVPIVGTVLAWIETIAKYILKDPKTMLEGKPLTEVKADIVAKVAAKAQIK